MRAETVTFLSGADETERLEKARVVLAVTDVVRIAGEVVVTVDGKDSVVAEVPGAFLHPEC